MPHIHNAEINLVAELVKRGKPDQKNFLVKDSSLEYRVLGTVENISHITDAKSFLTNYISCDFGDTTIEQALITTKIAKFDTNGE